MSVAMFLDVDQVLTKYSVQMQFAEKLKVADQLRDVEGKFRGRKATNTDFNEVLVPLFRQKGFTRDHAEKWFGGILLQPWAKNLLSVPNTTKYLVSSGPSYYVRAMADKWKIPQENVHCSEYAFDGEGLLDGCTAPVSSRGKALFVKSHAPNHEISIGLGDDPEQDVLFLSHCTIPILTTQSEEYLSAQKLESVLLMVQRLASLFPVVEDRSPTVFIGSSSEAKPLLDAIHVAISDDCRVVPWTQEGVFSPGKGTLDALMKKVREVDFAVLILKPDDILVKRGDASLAVRDNVLFELGLFMGRLGPSRTFMLYPEDSESCLPSDLDGITAIRYKNDEDTQIAVGAACVRLKNAIKKLGSFRG